MSDRTDQYDWERERDNSSYDNEDEAPDPNPVATAHAKLERKRDELLALHEPRCLVCGLPGLTSTCPCQPSLWDRIAPQIKALHDMHRRAS